MSPFIRFPIKQSYETNFFVLSFALGNFGMTVSTFCIADLALIRLENPVNFESKIYFWPICLPPKSISLHGQTAYVERRRKKDMTDCWTDNVGPKKRSKCRYPSPQLYSNLVYKACYISVGYITQRLRLLGHRMWFVYQIFIFIICLPPEFLPMSGLTER